VIRLLAQVKDGALRRSKAGVGQAGSLTLSGKIQPDGKASIDASSTTRAESAIAPRSARSSLTFVK